MYAGFSAGKLRHLVPVFSGAKVGLNIEVATRKKNRAESPVIAGY